MTDNNERRTLHALLAMLAVLWVWQFMFPAPVPEPTAETPVAAAAGEAPAAIPASASAAPTAVAAAPSEAPCTGATASLASPEVRLVATDCGSVRAVEFSQVNTAIVTEGWWFWAWRRVTGATEEGWRAYVAPEGIQRLFTDRGEFLAMGRGDYASGATWQVVSQDPLVQERTTPDGLKMRRTFKRTERPDVFEATIRFESDRPLLGPFWVASVDEFVGGGDRTHVPTHLEAVVDGDLEQELAVHELEPQTFTGPVSWFGVGDRYFLSVAAPAEPTAGVLDWRVIDAQRRGAFFTFTPSSLVPGSPIEQTFKVYTGPKDLNRLDGLGNDLDLGVDLGIFGFFARILLFTLHMFQGVLVNWGWSILALTVLVRLAIYPLARSAAISGKRMQALQGPMKALQEKYKDDKEALNREMMALYTRHGVNPIGGCLPMLMQMPVFFALFAALTYEPSLFHAEFFYLLDLSAYDPYGLLGLLTMIGMWVQQLMMPTTGMDETQARMLKIMPLVFGLFMFTVPAGLSLYYALNTVLSILQQWYNTRSIPTVVFEGTTDVAPPEPRSS